MARAVLLSMRASKDFGCAEKLSAAEQIKPDCCRLHLMLSPFLLTPLPVSCPSTTPHHYNYKKPYTFAEQTRPIVEGPNELDLNEEGTWECVTNEVTVDTEDQYDVTFVTAPEVPITIKRDRTATVLNPGGTPKR